jgi:putative DNA primase/helicase
VVELPGLGDSEDAVEWITRGGTREQLEELSATAPLWQAPQEEPQDPPAADDDTEIRRLAVLSLLEYGRQRKAAAKRLGTPVNILDKAVMAERLETEAGDGKAGRPLGFPEVEPWPQPVNGVELLDALSTAVRSYVIMTARQGDAIALWTVFTHAFGCFDVAPKLIAKSAEKRCGKTRLQEALARLIPKPLSISGISPSALLRVIEMHAPTILLDEVDAAMNQSREMAEALRGLLNGGFNQSNARRIINVPTPGGGFEPREFSLWAPQMLAGIGKLQDTVRDRSIEIEMLRKKPGEKVKRLRQRDGADLDELCRKSARWVADNSDALRDARLQMPSGLDDRAADGWEPRIAIADVAGGAWPERARQAAAALSGDGVKEDDSVRVLLLGDIKEIFAAHEAVQISSENLVDALIAIKEHPWADWKGGKPITQNGLARLLEPFKIKPKTIRLGDKTAKGYRFSDFSDTFERYLPENAQHNEASPSSKPREPDSVTAVQPKHAPEPSPVVSPEPKAKPGWTLEYEPH